MEYDRPEKVKKRTELLRRGPFASAVTLRTKLLLISYRDTVIHADSAHFCAGSAARRRPQGRHETVLCARDHAEAVLTAGTKVRHSGEDPGEGRQWAQGQNCPLTQVRRSVLPRPMGAVHGMCSGERFPVVPVFGQFPEIPPRLFSGAALFC